MKQFHIVWYTDNDSVSTGKNYMAFDEAQALMVWRSDYPTARFAVMYTPELVNTAKIQRDNKHLS